jgi:hypothetical protein
LWEIGIATINTIIKMKKILLLQIIAFLALSSFSQTQSDKHLTFKGVPIDGTLKEFVGRMKQDGFKFIQKSCGVVYLQGDFANEGEGDGGFVTYIHQRHQ